MKQSTVILSSVFLVNAQIPTSPFGKAKDICPQANKPAIVTGTNPNTIPDNKGSTIKKFLNSFVDFSIKKIDSNLNLGI